MENKPEFYIKSYVMLLIHVIFVFLNKLRTRQ